jgi:hypothetical protein
LGEGFWKLEYKNTWDKINVGNPIRKLPFGGSDPFMVILGMIYHWIYHTMGIYLALNQATSHRFDTMGYIQLDITTMICGFGTSPRCGLFEFTI